MNVAVLDASSVIMAINIVADDYTPQANEIAVETVAYVGGDYVDGHFYPPQLFPSWVRDAGSWVAPTPMPETEGRWSWDEPTLSWVKVTA